MKTCSTIYLEKNNKNTKLTSMDEAKNIDLRDRHTAEIKVYKQVQNRSDVCSTDLKEETPNIFSQSSKKKKTTECQRYECRGKTDI